MNDRPFIFITNDDGVGAKGLRTITQTALKYADVVVIAPEVSQSGMAHAVTMYQPLYLREVERTDRLSVYACTGTPVDCVKMGYDHLFEGRKPVLNISGINHGCNSAVSILYSGTMGAAIEASFYGAPSVGLSLLDEDKDADFDATVVFAERLIEALLANPVSEPVCLNVNVPQGRPEAVHEYRICRQNRGYWKEDFYCRKDPRGKDYYWLTGDFFNPEPEATDTDEWALANGYISVVPVQIDMTNYQQFPMIGRLLGEE